MIAPGSPSKPRTPFGYHRLTSAVESISVCLPMASPTATPARHATARSTTVVPSASAGRGRARAVAHGLERQPLLTVRVVHHRALVVEHHRRVARRREGGPLREIRVAWIAGPCERRPRGAHLVRERVALLH